MASSLVHLSVCRLLGILWSARRSESDQDIEVMVLRRQVRILQRQLHARVPYRPSDRADAHTPWKRAEQAHGRARDELLQRSRVHAGAAGCAARVGGQGEPQNVDGFVAAPQHRAFTRM